MQRARPRGTKVPRAAVTLSGAVGTHGCRRRSSTGRVLHQAAGAPPAVGCVRERARNAGVSASVRARRVLARVRRAPAHRLLLVRATWSSPGAVLPAQQGARTRAQTAARRQRRGHGEGRALCVRLRAQRLRPPPVARRRGTHAQQRALLLAAWLRDTVTPTAGASRTGFEIRSYDGTTRRPKNVRPKNQRRCFRLRACVAAHTSACIAMRRSGAEVRCHVESRFNATRLTRSTAART